MLLMSGDKQLQLVRAWYLKFAKDFIVEVEESKCISFQPMYRKPSTLYNFPLATKQALQPHPLATL